MKKLIIAVAVLAAASGAVVATQASADIFGKPGDCKNSPLGCGGK